MAPTQNSKRIVLVEDSTDDAELIGFALRNAPFPFTLERVDTEPAFRAALEACAPDLVLCDYHLPRFSMGEALRMVRDEFALDIPFIVVSRLIGEDAAVEAMRNGADDYLMKGRLGRLPGAIAAALERIETRRGKALAEAALRRSDLLNRSLLASLPMRIAVVDGAGSILAANHAWERARDHEGGDTVPGVGDNYLDWLGGAEPSDPRAALRAGIEAVVSRREAQYSLEYQLPMRTGSRWEAVRALPLQDSERGAVVSIEDITPRMLSHVALHDANARLQKLSRRVLAVQEEERRAIALELHDDLGQSLAAIKIALHGLQEKLPPEPARAVAHTIEIVDGVLATVRRLSYSLRPPQLDQFGLAGAIRALAEQQREATGIAIECRFGDVAARAAPDVEVACYRIVQEALNNAARHAGASLVVVELQAKDRLLQVAVRDDGAGFDEAQARRRSERSGSLGLVGMAERAQLAGGWFRVRSSPGAGTRISVALPMEGAPLGPAPEGGRA
jgi:signal transduction histidine kinase